MPKKNVRKTELVFLERRLAFLEDKLKSYENTQGTVINTLPVRICDMVPLEKQDEQPFFLMVLIIRKKDKHCHRCPIIKIKREILEELVTSEETVTIYDYLHLEKFAEKMLANREWIWALR